MAIHLPIAVVEHSPWDLAENSEGRKLDLPPEPGDWIEYPASLSRFGLTKMSASMYKRFMVKVDEVQLPLPPGLTGKCWLWNAGTHDKGYGRFYLGMVDERKVWAYSHRISFEHFVGFPPPGYIVDHRCNHKLCCAPYHLQAVTNRENLRLADERRPWKRRNQWSKE